MNKRALRIVIVILICGCTPYNRIILHSDSMIGYVYDPCDFYYLGRIIDSLGYVDFIDTTTKPEDCYYLKKEFLGYNPIDSTETLITVRPLLVGKDTTYIERIYSIDNRCDSILTIKCLSAEYLMVPSNEPRQFVKTTITYPKQGTIDVKMELGDR